MTRVWTSDESRKDLKGGVFDLQLFLKLILVTKGRGRDSVKSDVAELRSVIQWKTIEPCGNCETGYAHSETRKWIKVPEATQEANKMRGSL